MHISLEPSNHLPPFPAECLIDKFCDRWHEEMNAEICTNSFFLIYFVLLVLKYVEQLLLQITFSWFCLFFFFKKSKKLNLKLNQLYWLEFVSFRTVRTQNTQLLIEFQIGKEIFPKILFLCNSDRKNIASCSFFSPSSELKLNSSLTWFHLILFTIF